MAEISEETSDRVLAVNVTGPWAGNLRRAIQRPQMPDDVNAAALFLFSLGTGYITGQVLPGNGGFAMQ